MKIWLAKHIALPVVESFGRGEVQVLADQPIEQRRAALLAEAALGPLG